MVIGGIIVDNRTSTEEQVPWLGNIPVLGWLFKRKSTTQDRTALYFFVTPHILKDESFADLAEISYRKKLEAANTIGFERIRQIDLNFGPKTDDIDLSGFDVPLYSSPRRGEVDASDLGLDPLRVNELLEAGRERGGDTDPGEDEQN